MLTESSRLKSYTLLDLGSGVVIPHYKIMECDFSIGGVCCVSTIRQTFASHICLTIILSKCYAFATIVARTQVGKLKLCLV